MMRYLKSLNEELNISKLSDEETITLFNKLFVRKENHFVPIDMPVNIKHDEFKKIKVS